MECRKASQDMGILFVLCTEAVSYQLGLSASLANLRRDGGVMEVPDVFFACLDKNSTELWLVLNGQKCARDHYFKTQFFILHSLRAGSQKYGDVFSPAY